MSGFLIPLVTVVVVLGIMILVHEFGHFAAAKLLGVRVEVFSIGFGKRLIGFRRGETDYRISILPFLGGYVKMSGENPMDSHTGDMREFMSHPRWHRFIIAVAGPFMNIVLAVVLLTGVFMVRYEHPVYLDKPAVIGWVLEGSAADKAGIQAGDRIVRIDGVQDPTWEQVITRVLLSPRQPLQVAIERGGQVDEKSIVPGMVGPDEVGGNPGWLPDQPATVTEVDPKLPAKKAGILPGDNIVAVNHNAIRSIPAFSHFLQANKDKPLTITVVRDGKQFEFNLTPVWTQQEGEGFYRIGVRSDPQAVDKLPFAQAFQKSLSANRENSKLILLLVEKMVQRKVSMKQISGPIGIAQASGEAVRQPGWTPLLQLMSVISLNLGIFNLFPIPIMDGGVILLLVVESIMRRDISLRIKERIYQAAFVFLILFAVMVIYNDLTKAIPGLSQRLP